MEVMIGILIVSCAVIALWGSRHQWQRKQCRVCQSYIAARARKCLYCHTWQSRTLKAALLLLTLPTLASAQERWVSWQLDLAGHPPPLHFLLTIGPGGQPMQVPFTPCTTSPTAQYCAQVTCQSKATVTVQAQYAEGRSAASNILTCPTPPPAPVPAPPVTAPRNGMANAWIMWQQPVEEQSSTYYEALVTSAVHGQAVRRPYNVVPYTIADCQVHAASRGQPWTPDSLCADLCLPVGETTATLTARSTSGRSKPSNEAHYTVEEPCLPTGKPPTTTPKKPPTIPGWAIGVGATAVTGTSVALGSGPSLPELVNRQCVTWKILGPCMCNPFTPCVTVEYWEPAWLVEIVKVPGTTAIPILGDILKAGLSALGVSLFGGGGAGNSAGAGMGNLDYSEAHVWSFPQILGGPCTGCAPINALPKLLYASEADTVGWRTSTAPLSLPSPALLPVGVWGMLFPRTGFVIHGSPPVASGLRAFRAMNIAFQPATPAPVPEAHVVLSPAMGLSGCMQMASPKQTPCFPSGTPSMTWEHGAVSARGSYIWIFWTRRTCCVEPARATCGITIPGVGGHGANMCPL